MGVESSHRATKLTSRVWYLLAALVALAGLAAAGFSLWRTLTGIEDTLMRVTFPGQAELVLTEPGTHTIFVEYPTGIAPDPAVANLGLEVISPEGQSLPLNRPNGSFTYTVGGRNGEAVLQFEVDQPGTHLFAGDYPQGQPGPEATLTVSKGFGGRLFAGIGAVILIPIVTWSAATAIAVITFLRRRRTLRAAG